MAFRLISTQAPTPKDDEEGPPRIQGTGRVELAREWGGAAMIPHFRQRHDRALHLGEQLHLRVHQTQYIFAFLLRCLLALLEGPGACGSSCHDPFARLDDLLHV